jgi:hypothetical protein
MSALECRLHQPFYSRYRGVSIVYQDVIPAKAGIQLAGVRPHKTHAAADAALVWIPAFAGMTVESGAIWNSIDG